MQQNIKGPNFIITRQEGNNFAKIQTNDIVDEQQIKVIESNGGRLCNVWVFPSENRSNLYRELSGLNIHVGINTQYGVIDIKAPSTSEGISQNEVPQNDTEVPQNDTFTFDLDDNQNYVSFKYQLRRPSQLNENKLRLYKKLGYMNEIGNKQLIMISFYKSLLDELKGLNPNSNINETPRLKEIMKNYETVRINGEILCFSIKKKLYQKLSPASKYCLKKGVEQNGNILIVDECGNEKRIVSLALASLYNYPRPILIVVQNGKQKQWKNQIEKILGIKQITSLKNSQEIIEGSKVLLIIHKECMLKKLFLEQLNLKVCIVDERVSLNNDSDPLHVTKSIKFITNQCNQKIILSRAPILVPSELISQFKRLIDHNLKGLAYLTDKENIVDLFDPKKTKDFNEYIKKISELSTLKSSQKGIQRFKVQIRILTEENKEKAQSEEIWKFIEKLLVTGEKVVCFLHQQAIKKGVQDQFENSIYFKKNMSEDQEISEFQNDPNQKLIILTYRKNGKGIDLTAASAIVFGEIYFTNHAVMLQAEGSVNQSGQKQLVKCYYLVVNVDEEEKNFQVIKNNIFGFSSLIDGKKEEFQEMSSELEPIQKNFIEQEDSETVTYTTIELRQYFELLQANEHNTDGLRSVQRITKKMIKKDKQWVQKKIARKVQIEQ